MLSKLTFSLVFVLMLALVAGPALAQTPTPSGNLNPATGLDTDGDTTDAPIGENDFVVVIPVALPGTDPHIVLPADSTASPAVATRNADTLVDAALPNLKALFEFGGTVELLLGTLDATADADKTAPANYRLAITEIMWGEDANPTSPATAVSSQWIEVYNNGAALLAADEVRLVFTTNQRVDRLGAELTVADVPGLTAAATYTVVDRVSVVNRFGSRWALKGQSGRTTVGTNGEPITNLVSMYRKRGTSADKSMYTGTPNFGDGTEGGQWIQSVGRINMAGVFVGTPGAPHQDDASQITSAKTPAALPATAIVINEIYNGGADPNDLRWIEVHNTSDADVIIKKWEMEAVWDGGDDGPMHQRVFVLPDSDNVKVLAKGYLLITNTHPADSVLAGGVNVMDSNEFPKGATHRFIHTAVDLPDQDMMLVLRNRNDRNSNQRNGDGDPIGHEGIVDITGAGFVKVDDADLVTDVWPLKGWTQPGDRADADDFDTGSNSLGPNAGQTYTRWDNKTRANRLHKDDWRKVGFTGGLGYDPNVDSAVAPGTPGYAHNAQKANPADIADGTVVISEIMYDSGDNGNLVQWIELYNSSFTKSAHLNGDWELEIRNIDTDVESYVDAKFKFDGSSIILPNQTLLLVSDRSSASDVVDNRVYNLYQKHRNDLGLSARKSILLSSVGFHLELRYKTTVVDEVGNVMLDGPRRSIAWALPETGGDMRYSIIRGFGTQAPYDGVRDMANDGTMESSWIMAQSARSHYGHRDDMGSPGDRDGSPVPVSLSSFRPVRDKATGEVVIRWVTESELNNAGFNILRSETKDGEFKVINVKGLIAGHGTTSEKHVYTYTDTTAKPNIVYYYQIEDVSLNGERTTLRTTHLRGNVSAGGKLTTRWSELKSSGK